MNSHALIMRIALLAMLLLPALVRADSDQITLMDCGKETKCIPMQLNLSDAKKQEVAVGKKDLPGGYTQFALKVRGNLGGKSALLTVYFKGYTDGIDCSSFGQGNVGFLGNSSAGNPIVTTSSGPLEILDQDLIVGCKDCIQDAKQAGKATYLSTSWDLTLTNKKESDFIVDKAGNEFIQQDSNCLLVPKNDLLRIVQPAICSSKNPDIVPVKISNESCS